MAPDVQAGRPRKSRSRPVTCAGTSMAAAENREDWWVDRRRQREERMRYEVLLTLYQSAERCAEMEINTAGFVDRLGVWRAEFYRVVEYLDHNGFIRYLRGGPTVCLTEKGV